MVSVSPQIDINCKAGASLDTTTAQYRAVYFSADKTVSLITTATNFSAFAGVTQGYAAATGSSIPVRVNGVTKARYGYVATSTSYILPGSLVKPDVETTTAHGAVILATSTVTEFGTGGSKFILGKAISGYTRTTLTDTVQDTFLDIEILPQIINRCVASVTA